MISDKVIVIETCKTAFSITPYSEGNVWFQEEEAVVCFGTLDEKAERIGQLIRSVEPYSRSLKQHRKKLTNEMVGFTIKQGVERLKVLRDMSGSAKSSYHKYTNMAQLHYQQNEIIFRFMKQTPLHKFEYSYVNDDIALEPRITSSASNFDLGLIVFNWIANLNYAKTMPTLP